MNKKAPNRTIRDIDFGSYTLPKGVEGHLHGGGTAGNQRNYFTDWATGTWHLLRDEDFSAFEPTESKDSN